MTKNVKKLINDPDQLIDQLIKGMVSAHPDKIMISGKTGRAIAARSGPRNGKVGIVIGGGSGHEPAFAGYVGKGLADAAPLGNIFASPSPAQIVDAALYADRGAGVLFLYGNYAGDVMNFDMATDQLVKQGIDARSFLVTDDIASAPIENSKDRRGIAGDFFVFKVAGAAADLGSSLEAVEEAAAKANANTRTMGVALSACSMPQNGKANFHIPEGKMEIGMGIHGEPGVEQVNIETADEVTDRLLKPIIDELELDRGDKVAVLVNGLGSTTLLEQYIIHGRVCEILGSDEVEIHYSWVGEYCTSLEMAGVSISLLKLDAELQMFLDHPCNTPALTVGITNEVSSVQAPEPNRSVEHSIPIFKQDKNNLISDGDLTPLHFKAALLRIGADLSAAEDKLCELDGVIGDGDHGITMNIGWRAIEEELNQISHEATISEICTACSDTFLNSVGASVGPLYASGFRQAADAVIDRLNLDAKATALFISGFSEGIQRTGRAELGEKTMIDAWVPAARASEKMAAQGANIDMVLAAAAMAAREGADQTADLISKRGRSKVLGDRSIGHIDPGAESASIVIKSLACTIADLTKPNL